MVEEHAKPVLDLDPRLFMFYHVSAHGFATWSD